MKSLVLILVLFHFAVAHAEDPGCEKDLLPKGMAAYREFWESSFKGLELATPLTGVEYEALMDVNAGLHVTVKYANGALKTAVNGEFDFHDLKASLNVNRIVALMPSPAEQRYLRSSIYKPACELLGFQNCEAYDQPAAHGPGPLSDLQERALKWATIHVVPNHATYVLMKEFAAENALDFAELWHENEKGYAKFSVDMLRDAFTLDQVHVVFQNLVGPVFRAAFEARLYKEERAAALN